MSSRLTVTVPATGASGRADRFVADASGLSRSYVQRLISDGRVTRNGVPVRARDVLTPGATVDLDVPDPVPAAPAPEPIPLTIVYQDADLMIVDKPAGLVTHPAPGHDSGTLVNALLALAVEDGRGLASVAGIQRPGIVHRLDRDTSGLLMVARTDRAQLALQAQLKARRIHKRYIALVGGQVAARAGRIEAPLGRDPRDRLRIAIVPDGKEAITTYRVREGFHDWTLLELELVTGRTHQIRVHLASIGHAVAGDRLYATGRVRRGPDGLGRMFLHAWKLELTSVSGEGLIRVGSELPAELGSVLQGLRVEGERMGG